jgi:hypothetical protein
MKLIAVVGALVFVAGVGNAVAAEPASASGPSLAASHAASLEARVQRIEDHTEIERLLMEYGRYLDARDFASYSHLFSTNGEWSGSIGTFRGPAAIQAAMEKAFAGPAMTAMGTNFHLLTNAIIDIQGDRATAASKWTFVRLVENKPVIQLAGQYEDTLIRENGRWKFLRRVAPAATAPAAPPGQKGPAPPAQK